MYIIIIWEIKNKLEWIKQKTIIYNRSIYKWSKNKELKNIIIIIKYK
jgi:hypothetical protein